MGNTPAAARQLPAADHQANAPADAAAACGTATNAGGTANSAGGEQAVAAKPPDPPAAELCATPPQQPTEPAAEARGVPPQEPDAPAGEVCCAPPQQPTEPAAGARVAPPQQPAPDAQAPAAAEHSQQACASPAAPRSGSGSGAAVLQVAAGQPADPMTQQGAPVGSPAASPERADAVPEAPQSPPRHVTPARWQKLQQAAAGSGDIRKWLSPSRAGAPAAAESSSLSERVGGWAGAQTSSSSQQQQQLPAGQERTEPMTGAAMDAAEDATEDKATGAVSMEPSLEPVKVSTTESTPVQVSAPSPPAAGAGGAAASHAPAAHQPTACTPSPISADALSAALQQTVAKAAAVPDTGAAPTAGSCAADAAAQPDPAALAVALARAMAGMQLPADDGSIQPAPETKAQPVNSAPLGSSSQPAAEIAVPPPSSAAAASASLSRDPDAKVMPPAVASAAMASGSGEASGGGNGAPASASAEVAEQPAEMPSTAQPQPARVDAAAAIAVQLQAQAQQGEAATRQSSPRHLSAACGTQDQPIDLGASSDDEPVVPQRSAALHGGRERLAAHLQGQMAADLQRLRLQGVTGQSLRQVPVSSGTMTAPAVLSAVAVPRPAAQAAALQPPQATAPTSQAAAGERDMLLEQTCAFLAAKGVHDAENNREEERKIAGCGLRKQLCVRLPRGTGPDGPAPDVLEISFQQACRLLPNASAEYTLVGPHASQQQAVGFSSAADLTFRSSGQFAAFRQLLGIPRGSYVAVATCDQPSHLHILPLALPSQQVQPKDSRPDPGANQTLPPMLSSRPATARESARLQPLPASQQQMAPQVQLPPPMPRPAVASTPPITVSQPVQVIRAGTNLMSPAALSQQLQRHQQQQLALRTQPPHAMPHVQLPCSPVRQPQTAAAAGQAPAAAGQLPHPAAAAAASPAVVLRSPSGQPAAAIPQSPPRAVAQHLPAPLSPQQRQPTARQLPRSPVGTVSAAARTSAGVRVPREVTRALQWLMRDQPLGGRAATVQLTYARTPDGIIIEALSFTRDQLALLLPELSTEELPPTLITVNGTTCSTYPSRGWRALQYVLGFGAFRRAAGVQPGARVRVQAVDSSLPWLVVMPVQQTASQSAANAAHSALLLPQRSLPISSEPQGVVQVNVAAGRCWLRRQLQVQLGSVSSSAAGGHAGNGAAAAPLLSVPAQHVRNLLHPFARRSSYTLVCDTSGVQQDYMAFLSTGPGGTGDLCSSRACELAEFLHAAGISPGDRVWVATCNDMQHLHISQLRPRPHHLLTAKTAAATNGAAPTGVPVDSTAAAQSPSPASTLVRRAAAASHVSATQQAASAVAAPDGRGPAPAAGIDDAIAAAAALFGAMPGAASAPAAGPADHGAQSAAEPGGDAVPARSPYPACSPAQPAAAPPASAMRLSPPAATVPSAAPAPAAAPAATTAADGAPAAAASGAGSLPAPSPGPAGSPAQPASAGPAVDFDFNFDLDLDSFHQAATAAAAPGRAAAPLAAAAADGAPVAAATPAAAASSLTAAPSAPAAAKAQLCSILGNVTTVSGTAAGCRLARQLLVKLGDEPSGSKHDSLVADKLDIPSRCAHVLLGTSIVPRTYVAVADSGTQKRVVCQKGTFRSKHGFARFREAAGIPRGSYITVTACHDNPEHLHIAPAAAGTPEAAEACAGVAAAAAAEPAGICAGVAEVSLTSAGCRLVRQTPVRLLPGPRGTRNTLQLPDQVARALLRADGLRSAYTLVGDSGYQQEVHFEAGRFRTARGFVAFCEATGIPPGAAVLVAACENDPQHVHVALDAAAAVQQPDAATESAAAGSQQAAAAATTSVTPSPGDIVDASTTASPSSRGLADGVTVATGMAAGCQLTRQVEVQLQYGLRPGGTTKDFLSLPIMQARSLLGTPTFRRSYTFIAPSRRAADAAADRGTRREVSLSPHGFNTVSIFPSFRKAAGIRPGAKVLVAACATSPEHVHVAPASADDWEPQPAQPSADAAVPPSRQPLGDGSADIPAAKRIRLEQGDLADGSLESGELEADELPHGGLEEVDQCDVTSGQCKPPGPAPAAAPQPSEQLPQQHAAAQAAAASAAVHAAASPASCTGRAADLPEPAAVKAGAPARGAATGIRAVSGDAAGCQLVRQLDVRLRDEQRPTSRADCLVLPNQLACELLGERRRAYTFVAPSPPSSGGVSSHSGVRREVIMRDAGFRTISGFTKFRKAACIRPGAVVTVSACATSPDHVHMAPASAAGWDLGAAGAAASPQQPPRNSGPVLPRPTASGPCTVVLAQRAADKLLIPEQLLRMLYPEGDRPSTLDLVQPTGVRVSTSLNRHALQMSWRTIAADLQLRVGSIVALTRLRPDESAGSGSNPCMDLAIRKLEPQQGAAALAAVTAALHPGKRRAVCDVTGWPLAALPPDAVAAAVGGVRASLNEAWARLARFKAGSTQPAAAARPAIVVLPPEQLAQQAVDGSKSTAAGAVAESTAAPPPPQEGSQGAAVATNPAAAAAEGSTGKQAAVLCAAADAISLESRPTQDPCSKAVGSDPVAKEPGPDVVRPDSAAAEVDSGATAPVAVHAAEGPDTAAMCVAGTAPSSPQPGTPSSKNERSPARKPAQDTETAVDLTRSVSNDSIVMLWDSDDASAAAAAADSNAGGETSPAHAAASKHGSAGGGVSAGEATSTDPACIRRKGLPKQQHMQPPLSPDTPPAKQQHSSPRPAQESSVPDTAPVSSARPAEESSIPDTTPVASGGDQDTADTAGTAPSPASAAAKLPCDGGAEPQAALGHAAAQQQAMPQAQGPVTVVLPLRNAPRLVLPTRLNRLLWPDQPAAKLLQLCIQLPGGGLFPVTRSAKGLVQQGWPAVAAALQLQLGDLLAFSRRGPLEGAGAGNGGGADTSGRHLDLHLRRLEPLVQGGALAAATAAWCPLRGNAGRVEGWPLRAVARSTVIAAVASRRAAAQQATGAADPLPAGKRARSCSRTPTPANHHNSKLPPAQESSVPDTAPKSSGPGSVVVDAADAAPESRLAPADDIGGAEPQAAHEGAAVKQRAPLAQPPVTVVLPQRNTSKLMLPIRLNRLLWPEHKPTEPLKLCIMTPGGMRFSTARNVNGYFYKNWPKISAMLQLQPGDLLAISRRVQRTAADAGAGNTATASSCELDLEVQKLKPLVQGGALAAATAAACPVGRAQLRRQGDLEGWPLDAVAPDTIAAAVAFRRAHPEMRGGAKSPAAAKRAGSCGMTPPPPAKRRRCGSAAPGTIAGSRPGKLAPSAAPSCSASGAAADGSQLSSLGDGAARSPGPLSIHQPAASASVASTFHVPLDDTALSPAPPQPQEPFPQALAAVDAPVCGGGDQELRLPHSTSAVATFLDGSDLMHWATQWFRETGARRSGCVPLNILILVAKGDAQQAFHVHFQLQFSEELADGMWSTWGWGPVAEALGGDPKADTVRIARLHRDQDGEPSRLHVALINGGQAAGTLPSAAEERFPSAATPEHGGAATMPAMEDPGGEASAGSTSTEGGISGISPQQSGSFGTIVRAAAAAAGVSDCSESKDAQQLRDAAAIAAAAVATGQARGGYTASGADGSSEGTTGTGRRSKRKRSMLRAACVTADGGGGDGETRQSPPPPSLWPQPSAQPPGSYPRKDVRSKVLKAADVEHWDRYLVVSKAIALDLLPRRRPPLQQGDDGSYHDVPALLMGGTEVMLQYLQSCTPGRDTISGSAWQAWAAAHPVAPGAVLTMSRRSGERSVVVTLKPGPGGACKSAPGAAGDGGDAGPLPRLSTQPQGSQRTISMLKEAPPGSRATGVSHLRTMHGSVAADSSAGGGTRGTWFASRSGGTRGPVWQPPAAMRQGFARKQTPARLSTAVLAAPDAAAEKEALQLHTAAVHQRGTALDESRWEAIISRSEEKATKHAKIAVATFAAALERGHITLQLQLQPLPSDAELEALPAEQRPEPRAYFAQPFAWRYKASNARASLGGCPGVPESALLPPKYPGNPRRGSLWAVLTQGLQYRLLANMCTGRRAPIGWQVLALEDIPAKRFIIEYTGQYLSSEAAEAREAEAAEKHESRCFLWDLVCTDIRKEKESRTVRGEHSPVSVIDAKHTGNMSKLFNHCCSPNVKAVEVRQRHGYARILMFALRDIKRGEHLDLDYIPGFTEEHLKKNGLKPCLCGANNCRGVTL